MPKGLSFCSFSTEWLGDKMPQGPTVLEFSPKLWFIFNPIKDVKLTFKYGESHALWNDNPKEAAKFMADFML